jgi:hypothetical protein
MKKIYTLLLLSIFGACNFSTEKEVLKSDYPSAIDDVLTAYFSAVSGVGEHDWAALEAICLSSTQFNSMGINDAGENTWHPTTLTEFESHMGPYIAREGFYQKSIRYQVDYYNKVAQAWVLYESRNNPDGPLVDKGMASFHLVQLDGQWKVANVIWNSETKDKPISDF